MSFIFEKKSVSDFSNLNDEEIFSLYLEKRDRKIAAELFKRYTHLVFGVCMKYLSNTEDAKDAVMTIFEQLMNAKDPGEIKNFRGWLYTVSKNFCLMKIRSAKPASHFSPENIRMPETEFMEFPDAEHLMEEEEKEIRAKRLKMAIAQLKEEQKRCIELFYLENKVYKEISEMTGYDLNAVKSHIQNGKRNLKNLLGHGKE